MENRLAQSRIRILMLEDDPNDEQLLIDGLRKAGFDPEWVRVDDESGFLAALDPSLDLILADYRLPRFDGLRGLYLVRERGLDVPFILVSGVIGEEAAVAAMREGASDYLLKDRLARLGIAVERVLEQRRLRHEKRSAELALQETARHYRIVSELTSDYAYVIHVEPGKELVREWVTDLFLQLVGATAEELEARGGFGALVHPDDRWTIEAHDGRLLSGQSAVSEYRIVCRGGGVRWLRDRAQPAWDPVGHRVSRIYGAARDVTEVKRAEEALAASEAGAARLAHELEAARRTKAELVATISHDLRTSLDAVVGHAGRLLDGAFGRSSPEQTDALRQLEGSARALRATLDRILDLGSSGRSPGR